MLAILNSLIARNLTIFQPILMILVSKFMVHRALSDKTNLLLGLQSPLNWNQIHTENTQNVAIFLISYFIQEFYVSGNNHNSITKVVHHSNGIPTVFPPMSIR